MGRLDLFEALQRELGVIDPKKQIIRFVQDNLRLEAGPAGPASDPFDLHVKENDNSPIIDGVNKLTFEGATVAAGDEANEALVTITGGGGMSSSEGTYTEELAEITSTGLTQESTWTITTTDFFTCSIYMNWDLKKDATATGNSTFQFIKDPAGAATVLTVQGPTNIPGTSYSTQSSSMTSIGLQAAGTYLLRFNLSRTSGTGNVYSQNRRILIHIVRKV